MAMAGKTTILNRTLEKGQSVRSTRLFLYLRQATQGYSCGLDILKQVEKEQVGVPAGHEAIRRLHEELSVGSRIEASTLRDEMLRFKAGAGWDRPLDTFRAIQVEVAKFARLIGGFPDLKLTEPDCCMVVLKNLGVEVKRYIRAKAASKAMHWPLVCAWPTPCPCCG